MNEASKLTRRQMVMGASGLICGGLGRSVAAADQRYVSRYILSSCMYGYQYIGEILPEVARTGASAIDIWPKVHGNQREQMAEFGEEKFKAMLKKHGVSLGCLTQYPLGPFGLRDEMRVAARFGTQTIVTGAVGPKGLKGTDLKSAVKEFITQMRPHLEVAEECGVTIAIENHANSLIESPASMQYLAELSPSSHLAIAFAPYHLPQDSRLLARLIRALGDKIAMLYAWEHGMGCMKRLPKEQELMQLPGRGGLDFRPLWEALADINYRGWTSIFMHPVPRGIPIRETAAEVTAEINRARSYLDGLLV